MTELSRVNDFGLGVFWLVFVCACVVFVWF